MSILTLKSVSKSFGALKVTDGVSLEVQTGEALGIIGPNGAGKSTLFNLIAGNIKPDEGQILLDGTDVSHWSPMERVQAGVGRSFQIPQPFNHLSVFENLMVAAQFGGAHRGSEASEFCMSILEKTGLAPSARDMAGGLSLLQRKRLELARAMATSPKLILLDEIAGGLTDGECGDLIKTIKDIHSQGTSIIWIEHVLHALTSVVDRLMVLNFGENIMVGGIYEVMNAPAVREIYLGLEV
ncbi:ABC transporter ATP-binding protein [Phaeobacter gallaeciensis]|uniref:Amino acid/amide ABC transporter ATP-binding protein 1, HAAT family n=1 Tax=Phaeobacter gallaeciensis TaxID=60890 RepID=A0AAD0EDG2_9RHOB|nr:ABC transporter ATP-binding protein [Phaeobacter gallaeciensis]AHD11896.1 amino acid/amide ABC transporter ATP-binding protein 1, HAAT family [Phaeobacter gallaeciensis DSM 26640]ATE95159.1 amino acid/amide ABC transporter ATP-binding protein 1, HAAT family [Phaeobacter gallaeciensis]ATE99467.1 amino acid/amide ABC transporter ATP-binding protein 1, HAAT family [Phaeobacter gallaeciensis]ATF03864.1 amino acid/amide ABC transporter ATP-binding protein 1, HAAT family [Phaeobacter gallaeciensis